MNSLCRLTSGSVFVAVCSLLRYVYTYVYVCDMWLVIVVPYNFLPLTGKEGKEGVTKKEK